MILNPKWTPENEDTEEHMLDMTIPVTAAEIMEQCKPTINEIMAVIGQAKQEVCKYISSLQLLIFCKFYQSFRTKCASLFLNDSYSALFEEALPKVLLTGGPANMEEVLDGVRELFVCNLLIFLLS